MQFSTQGYDVTLMVREGASLSASFSLPSSLIYPPNYITQMEQKALSFLLERTSFRVITCTQCANLKVQSVFISYRTHTQIHRRAPLNPWPGPSSILQGESTPLRWCDTPRREGENKTDLYFSKDKNCKHIDSRLADKRRGFVWARVNVPLKFFILKECTNLMRA